MRKHIGSCKSNKQRNALEEKIMKEQTISMKAYETAQLEKLKRQMACVANA